MREPRHISHAAKRPEGPVLDRRALLGGALACAGVAAGLLGPGCHLVGDGSASADPGEDGSDTGGEPSDDAADSRPNVAHQAAVEDDGTVYYVGASTGSVAKCDLAGQSQETLYSNGQTGLAGVRYVAEADGEVFFCDVPSASLKAVPVGGGDARVVWQSQNAGAIPLPIVVDGGTVYLSLLDQGPMTSTLCAVGTDGSGWTSLCTAPEGFFHQYVDAASGRTYYAGVNSVDARQVRSSKFDGTDERLLFSMDGIPSAQSSLTWQIESGRVFVDAQDDVAHANRFVSRDLEGADEQILYDFSSQRVMFDRCGPEQYFVDRDTLAVMAWEEGGELHQVGTLTSLGPGCTVSSIEAGSGVAWVVTVTPGENSASEYATHMVVRETGAVTVLV